MRCPKCGYITFDHLNNCPKCKKDISKISSKVVGTTYSVTTPSFLKFPKGEQIEEGQEDLIAFDNSQDDFDVVDPDLDILVNEPEEDDDFNFDDDSSFVGNDFEDSSDDDFGLNSDEPEDGELDLDGFEDAFEQEESGSEGDIALEFPDELADISDLSPSEETPAGKEDDSFSRDFDEKDNEEDFMPALEGVDDDFNLDLDLEMDSLDDEFTLSLDDEETDSSSILGELSLDDIGLSDKPSDEKKKRRVPASDDDMDMDGDLDFNLDLGGLSLDKE